jgi:ABC-type Fe3+-hydroxamate transport system substrate-binding protein
MSILNNDTADLEILFENALGDSVRIGVIIVGVTDAFEGSGVEGYTGSESVDDETLLEIDPDALVLRYHGRGMTRGEFEETIVGYLENHDLGSNLTAVEEGRVFAVGRYSPDRCTICS